MLKINELKLPLAHDFSFPRSAWECIPMIKLSHLILTKNSAELKIGRHSLAERGNEARRTLQRKLDKRPVRE